LVIRNHAGYLACAQCGGSGSFEDHVLLNVGVVEHLFYGANNTSLLVVVVCCNPSFGLVIKAKGLQGCKPRGSPRVKARGSMGVTSHTPGSVRKCEGV